MLYHRKGLVITGVGVDGHHKGEESDGGGEEGEGEGEGGDKRKEEVRA